MAGFFPINNACDQWNFDGSRLALGVTEKTDFNHVHTHGVHAVFWMELKMSCWVLSRDTWFFFSLARVFSICKCKFRLSWVFLWNIDGSSFYCHVWFNVFFQWRVLDFLLNRRLFLFKYQYLEWILACYRNSIYNTSGSVHWRLKKIYFTPQSDESIIV